MKLSNILTGVFLLLSMMCQAQTNAQDSLIQYYHKYPQQALKDAESWYNQAQQKHDTPLLIKSLLLKTAMSVLINEDEYPRMVTEVEEFIQKENDVRARSILHSYLGQLYLQYYSDNSYVIGERTALQGDIPQDMAEWSGNIFQAKILDHFKASVAPQQELQQTAVSEYELLLIPGAASDSLRPTLYDFLAHRAIDLLSANRHCFNSTLSDLNEQPAILNIATDFVRIPVTLEPLELPGFVLKVWQDLLSFRLHNSNQAALILADLERLDYYYPQANFPDRTLSYRNTLAAMHKEYLNNPLVIEIIAKEAANLLEGSHRPQLLRNYTESEPDQQKNIEKALALCQEGIRLYPHYPRINLLHALISKIQSPDFFVSYPQCIYPGEKFSLKVSSRNLRQLEVVIYRVDTTTAAYLDSRDKKDVHLPQVLTYKHTYSLNTSYNVRDSILKISIPKAGLYKLLIKTKGAKHDLSDFFICSRLFGTHQSAGQGLNFQVRDWQSGIPVKNAKILIYKHRYPELVLTDSVVTDATGMASYKAANQQRLFYEVVNANNPNHFIQAIYNYQDYDVPSIQTKLITDRKIYRPGQTVYFKGITWKATTDTLYPLVNKTIDISFRNPQYKTVSEQKAVSDSYGSFTGSVTIPSDGMNGRFTLNTQHAQTDIIVADYKRPELNITFEKPQRSYYQGDTVQVRGYVKSFSGSPLANTEIEYEISSYSLLTRYNPSPNSRRGITHSNGNGEFEISFIADETSNGTAYPVSYEITVKVTDAKGETQESMTYLPVYPGTAEPVIDLPEQVNKDRVTYFHIRLNNLAPHSQPQSVRYTIARITPPAVISTHPIFRDTIVEEILLEGHLSMTAQDSIGPKLSQYPSGAYLLSVKCGDMQAKRIFYLYSWGDKRPPIPTYKWLVKEKTLCRPGDTARIQFGTSARNAYVVYEIYTPRQLIKRSRPVLSDEIINIEIPYLEKYGNEIWLSIYYVKDKKYIDELIPITRLREDRTLTIQTTVFRDHLLPGAQEEWKIRILNTQGQPAIAQVLAFMYDASLDQLAKYNLRFSPDYQYRRFRYDWTYSYLYEGKNTLSNLYTRNPNLPKYRYPAFNFDKLNTFNYNPDTRFYMRNLSMTKASVASVASDEAFAQENVEGETTGPENQSERPLEIQYRTDFQETAFFYPQLQSDSSGIVDIRFKIPQSLTEWKFVALAYTKELASGQLERYITTSKPLMVHPNLPRFFRSGDKTVLKVTVDNLSDTIQAGTAGIEFFLPGNDRVLLKRTADFRIAAGKSQTLSFAIEIPGNIDLIGCRIFAGNTVFSDGEQHLLPVLPNETLVTETVPIYSTQSGTHTYTIANHSSTRKNYRLTLELSANPIWYAVLALPTLTEPLLDDVTDIASAYYVNTIANRIVRSNPRIAAALRNWEANRNDPTLLSQLERNSELKSILLEASPWVLEAENETERMQTLSKLFDVNRLEYLQNQAMSKLAALQTPEGGWSWFKGMPTSRFITTDVLTMMARAVTTGEIEYGSREKEMQIKALRFLDHEIKKDFGRKPKQIGYDQIIYLYTRSLYRDIPLGDALDAHKYYLALAQKQWSDFSLYEKALISIALTNYGFRQEAQEILRSLRQYAVTTPELGTYWPNNRNTYYRNSAVQIHTVLMEAFQQANGNAPELKGMKQWLLRQKQVQNWGNVPSTVDAIYALLLTGKDQLSQNEQLNVEIGKQKLTVSGSANPIGYLKASYPAGEIHPDMLTVKVTKSQDSPSWGGLYLQYFEKMDRVKKQKTDLSIDKKLYVEKINAQGKPELMPLRQQELSIGDKVVVRLTLSLNRDMEFVHLKDLRAACFEPVEQLSGNQWKFGTVYYQEVKDAATNFFFNSLSRGTYVLEYPMWVNQAGSYQDGIATLQSFYAPEYNAVSPGENIHVKDEPATGQQDVNK